MGHAQKLTNKSSNVKLLKLILNEIKLCDEIHLSWFILNLIFLDIYELISLKESRLLYQSSNMFSITFQSVYDKLCIGHRSSLSRWQKTIKRIKNTHILNGNESYVNTGVSVEIFKNILPERTVNLKWARHF